MSLKHKFINSAIQVLKHNKDGSYRTQNDRRVVIMDVVKSIYAAGYQLEHVRYLKRRHVQHMIAQWQNSGAVGAGSLKNRLSHIRWLMRKLNKENVVPNNDALGIPKRRYVTNEDKSRELIAGDLKRIADPTMRLILRGQQLFGLRVEESLKIQPHLADAGQYLHVVKTKGGRERVVPILTDEQRQWIAQCKAIALYKHSSMIPEGVSYKTYRKRFSKCCEKANINKLHGLRHHYAQQRFATIAGFPCTVKNGPTRSTMTTEQRCMNTVMRLIVSQELGHSRIHSITSLYLGK